MNNSIFEAVVFDMDGVVIDTRKPIEDFWFKLGEKYQINITQELMDKKIHGCPARQSVYALFTHFTTEQKEELLEECEVFEVTLDYVAMRGVKDLLTGLHTLQVPVALVTSSLPTKVTKVFDKLGLNGLFDTVVTSDLVEKGKPDPACYLLAAKRLGKNPENCIVFEDAVSGIKAAVGARMFTIGVGTSSQEALLKQTGAQAVVPDFNAVTVAQKDAHVLLSVKPDVYLQLTAGQYIAR